MTKVPAETPAPPSPLVRRTLSLADGIEIARRLEEIGYDAVVPVQTSVVWDMSIIRGEYPERAWDNEALREEYDAAFGGSTRRQLVSLANRVQSLQYDFEPAWNEAFCRRVHKQVSIPVLGEGGIRGRGEMDRLLGSRGGTNGSEDSREEPACDMVGMARPFYAEPRVGARLLGTASGDENPQVLCESCNNCTVPQVTGAPGICRTPAVLRNRGELEREGAYDRLESE